MYQRDKDRRGCPPNTRWQKDRGPPGHWSIFDSSGYRRDRAIGLLQVRIVLRERHLPRAAFAGSFVGNIKKLLDELRSDSLNC